MANQGGTWGFKGQFDRALEFPNGESEEVSPPERARLRYNHTRNTLQLSRDQGPYEDLALKSSSIDRRAYSYMPVTWVNTSYPLDLGTLQDIAINDGGEELWQNFSTYTRTKFRAVLGDSTVFDPLSFSSLSDVVSWVNANVPNDGNNFTTQCRVFSYDEVDDAIHPLQLVFGRNANWARLRSRYWGATEASVSSTRWSQTMVDADTTLYELWDVIWPSPLTPAPPSTTPWTDNERQCFWMPHNSKRTYDFPNKQALATGKIRGNSVRYMWRASDSARVSSPTGNTSWDWGTTADNLGYVAVAPNGTYQDVAGESGSIKTIQKQWLRQGWSVLGGIPLENSSGDRSILIKPIGIDQVYFQYVNPSTHRIEIVSGGADRDLTRRMRVLSPVFNTPGQYSGPCTIDQWWDACTRTAASYTGHGPGLGIASFQLRDLSTNLVSTLSAAQVKWLRRYRGRPLACVIGNKP